jgi:predicted HicB family RNase H-like nuclease
MENKKCKVCGQIINVGEGSAFEGVHIKCAREYLNRGNKGPVLHGDENAPQKRVDLNKSSRHEGDVDVDLNKSSRHEGGAVDSIKSNSVKVDCRVSAEVYEALIAEVEKNESSVSKYVRDIIENHLSRV